MHMADALISPAVAGTMYACSAAAAGYSIKKVRMDTDTKKSLSWELWEPLFLRRR